MDGHCSLESVNLGVDTETLATARSAAETRSGSAHTNNADPMNELAERSCGKHAWRLLAGQVNGSVGPLENGERESA